MFEPPNAQLFIKVVRQLVRSEDGIHAVRDSLAGLVWGVGGWGAFSLGFTRLLAREPSSCLFDALFENVDGLFS